MRLSKVLSTQQGGPGCPALWFPNPSGDSVVSPRPPRGLAQAVGVEFRAPFSQDSPLLSPPHFTPDFFPTIDNLYQDFVARPLAHLKKGNKNCLSMTHC